MTVLGICKLIALIMCCVQATISDIREGIISNKLIITYGAVGLVTDIIVLLTSSVSDSKVFLLNAGSVIIMAFVLYFLRIWAGGDCKLLVVIALLIPHELYWGFDSTPFTLWYSVGFMFGIGFVYIVIESIVLWFRDDRGKYRKETLMVFKRTVFQYIKALVYMSALTHIYLYFVDPYVKVPNAVLSMAFILCIWKIRSFDIYRSMLLTVIVAMFDLGMTLFTGTITVSTNGVTYLIVLAFMILRVFTSKYNYQNIDTVNVKRGMILSQVSSILMQNSKIEGLPTISDESLNSRISEEEANSIIRWSKTKNGLKQITIVRKIPFAVFITSGTLMYLLARGVLK